MPLLLLAAGIALAAVIYAELDRPAIEPPAQAATPQPPAHAMTAPTDGGEAGFAMPPLEAYAETVARPIFSPSRRAAPRDADAAPLDGSAAYTLVGVVVSPELRHALVAHGQPPRLERLTEGQTIDGWTVRAIAVDRVVLQRGETQLEIRPKDRAAPRAANPRGVMNALPPSIAGRDVPAPPDAATDTAADIGPAPSAGMALGRGAVPRNIMRGGRAPPAASAARPGRAMATP